MCAFVTVMAVTSAQRAITVGELVSFIKDSIHRKQDDRLVADYLLKRMKMKERLDDKTVEVLEGLGAGPRTVAALHKLSRESAGLSAAAPAPPPQVATPAPPPRRRPGHKSRSRFWATSGRMRLITVIICRTFCARR